MPSGRTRRVMLLIGLSNACNDPSSGLVPAAAPSAAEDAEVEASPDMGVAVDQDVGVDPDAADSGVASDVGSAPGTVVHRVRFVALGDTGEGNEAQYEVSRAIETVCMVQGCDFALLLGDNFYDSGVTSVNDEQFREKFEHPYANLQLPFWVTLGNHDFGEIPLQFWRTDHQIDYTMLSWKWNMPDHFYTFVQEHVTFISLDTNMIMLGLAWVRDQRDWLEEQLERAETPWIVAFGHHPYKSNGSHGNAGNYEGAGPLDFTGIVSGRDVEAFFDDLLCDRVDLYLSGHDHNRQWLEDVCGMELIVSGAGAKTSELRRRDGNPVRFEEDSKEGFFWIEIADDRMTVEAWDRAGQLDHRGSVTRRSR